MFYMNAEFIAMLDYLERERGIKREILLEAVSNALLSASKKSVGASRDLRIDINPKSGEIRALVGGRDYAQSKFNRALAPANRQPGSEDHPDRAGGPDVAGRGGAAWSCAGKRSATP